MTPDYHEQSLPANLDAERATLGSCLLNRDAILAIAPWLNARDFYLERHALVYTAICACLERRIPADARTIADELTRREQLDLVGGMPFLAELVACVPTSYHVEHYAKVVERLAVLRRLIAAGAQIACIGYDGKTADDLDVVIADAQACLNEATARATDSGFTSYQQIAHRVYDTLSAESNDHALMPAVATGYVDLDELLVGGLHRGDLIILAARPSVGKSALAGCIAAQVAEQQQQVLIVSLEMGDESWFARNAAALSGTNLASVRSGRMRDDDLHAYVASIQQASHLPVYVNDASSMTPSQLRSSVLKWVALHGRPDLLIIDYLQLMLSSRRNASREQEVADISRSLKALARELDCPVLALSQLSRAVEGRASHVPMLSDLRESGSLEQDADVVVFIYREELYDKETDKRGIAELHVAKHRNGPLGVVAMRFDAQTTSFCDLTYRTPDGYAGAGRRSDDEADALPWPTYD